MPSNIRHEEYARRLAKAQERQREQQRRERLVGYSQLAVVSAAVLWVLWLLRHWSSSAFLLVIPVAAFVVLAAIHERLIRSVGHWSRVVRFYERGLERLDDRWAGKGETGERFLDLSHAYAQDLDLFGKASIFELLCTARTRAGEETLARWLLAPAPIDEIIRRQAAALELRERLDFRETVSALGEILGAGIQPQPLAAWGEEQPIFESRLLRMVTPLLAVVWVVSVICWGVLGYVALVAASTVVNLVLSQVYRPRVHERAHAVADAGHDLKLLSEVLTAFEQERFTSPKLVELQAMLKRGEVVPSAAIAELNRRLQSLESGHNLIIKMFDPVVFWNLQYVLAIEAWRKRFGPAIRIWIEAVGELEALLALSGYAYEHPGDVFPEFIEEVDSAGCFRAEGLAHPLIPLDKAARNDLELGGQLQVVILSGPNMAGKSTFLRGIGVNAVLAQCGAPVRANKLWLSRLAVTASICVLDSLQGGISRFYAEIHRLKQIVDLTQGSLPVLFLLDELLSGTNSHDRLAGSRSIVEKLFERNAIGLVTTHDLALTRIPETLGRHVANFHFADRLEDGELRFDYKLRPGPVQTSNALELMRSIGLEV